jgi:hypothetical protein
MLFTSFCFFLLQVTYSSDYFPELFDLAVELIKRGRAYVDHQVCRCGIKIAREVSLIFFLISSIFHCADGASF